MYIYIYIVGALWGVAARPCLILLATFLCSCGLASSPAVLLASKWCIHTAVSTRPLGHLPPITKTIQVRWTRDAGHCWRSRDELISDVLHWNPIFGRVKAGRPARTCIQQQCEETECSPKYLSEAMNDREKWRERVRDIRAGGTTWWWWYIYI